MKLKWSGKLDELGYSIVSESTKQRLFGLNLNSYRIYDFGKIKIKVHYSIGNSEDSINLNFWSSYESFLNILEKLLDSLLPSFFLSKAFRVFNNLFTNCSTSC